MEVKDIFFRYKKKILIATGVFLFLAVSFFLLMLAAHLIVENAADGKTYSEIASMPHRNVGLLLGCSQLRSSGRINLFFKYRIEAGAALFKAGKIDYIIVSGDNHHVTYDEVGAMKVSLIEAGVPEERIYCDYAGFRTIDSIIRAKAIFGLRNVTVISQKFHNERAIYLAENKGMDAIGFNATDVRGEESNLKMKIREKFSRIKAVFDVNIINTKPRFYGPPVEIGEGKRQ